MFYCQRFHTQPENIPSQRGANQQFDINRMPKRLGINALKIDYVRKPWSEGDEYARRIPISQSKNVTLAEFCSTSSKHNVLKVHDNECLMKTTEVLSNKRERKVTISCWFCGTADLAANLAVPRLYRVECTSSRWWCLHVMHDSNKTVFPDVLVIYTFRFYITTGFCSFPFVVSACDMIFL